MNENLKEMTFVAACRQFFGMLPNETLQEFVAELKALTPQDKLDLIEMFKSVGINATKQS